VQTVRNSVDGNTLAGIAITYNNDSRTINERGLRFTERIAPGAFDSALSGADVKLYYNHDVSMPLARTISKTLTLSSTAQGIAFSADIPDTTLGRDIKTLLQRGDLTGEMSFGFIVRDDSWNKERTERIVRKADLLEISLVQDPAYPNTHSALRSFEAARNARTITLRGRMIANG
jgi:hypothetical protein